MEEDDARAASTRRCSTGDKRPVDQEVRPDVVLEQVTKPVGWEKPIGAHSGRSAEHALS